MKITKSTARRAFIKTSLWAFLLTLAAPIKAWSSGKNPYLLNVFKDKAMVGNIGRKYLQQHPEEKDQLRQLLAGIDDMKRQTTKEFKRSLCVTIDGWVLAQSEARECAVYYLKNSGYAY